MGTDNQNLKESINNLIWSNAPGDLTLDTAEELAIEIMKQILEGKK